MATMLRRLGRLGTGAATLALSGAMALTAAPAAAADEIYPRPADGSITLRGHGWGHGIGMSQYGSYGAAVQGRSWQQIIAFYYRGTSLGSVGNPTIRVRVASLGTSVQARPESGLAVSWDGSSSTGLRSVVKAGEPTVARWRFVTEPGNATRVRLDYQVTGASDWRHFTTSPSSTAMFLNRTSGTVTTYRGGTAVVYRGQVRAVRTSGWAGLTPVVALPMESYLRSVVPSESPASWPTHALRAQAVAARSFAEHHRRYAPLWPAWYDVYDDTRSQVFRGTRVGGTSYEYASTDTAVSATAGQAATYNGRIAFTQFSSSTGGWTDAGSQPYLVAQADAWDGTSANPNRTWSAEIPVSRVESAYPSIGSYRRMVITARNGYGSEGGRVRSLRLEGSQGSVTLTGNQARSAFGLKSNWFIPTDPPPVRFTTDVTGDGRPDVMTVAADTGELRAHATGGSSWSSSQTLEARGWNGYARVVSVGTWDGDRIGDVFVQMPDGRLYLRPGTGSGFGVSRQIGSGWGVHDKVFGVGDFDGDGRYDVMARRRSDSALFLYSGDGAGGFRAIRQIGSGWHVFTEILGVGDFDGDGSADVLARKTDGYLMLYRGNGRGGWLGSKAIGRGWQIFDRVTAVGDVTGDERADVVARTPDGVVYVYPGNGSGGWQARLLVARGWQAYSRVL